MGITSKKGKVAKQQLTEERAGATSREAAFGLGGNHNHSPRFLSLPETAERVKALALRSMARRNAEPSIIFFREEEAPQLLREGRDTNHQSSLRG